MRPDGLPRPETLSVGFGTDMHALRPGDGLVLGGVVIPCAHAFVADSDGDVLLHAVIDAMLGCAGLGDIGDHFPLFNVIPGESSARFVRETLELLRGEGVTLLNVDCIVDVDVVKLRERKRDIRDSVAALLGLPPDRVNVKAKTAEGMGPVGEGRAAAAQAVVLAARQLR